MNKPIMNTLRRGAIALLLAVAAATPLQAGEIRISVAASLKDAIGEIADTYTKKHPGTTFIRNFASSGALANQIDQGAPADLYISANRKWMAFLREKEAIDRPSESILAHNSLVFTGMTKQSVASMQELEKLDRIAIGSPKSVPAGDYAMKAIVNSGMEGKLKGKLVMAKDVRECLLYAELGEVDGGFVYRTDAMLARRATIRFTVPRELYGEVAYPMALTKAGASNAEARAFIDYLNEAEARTVLEKYGFVVD